MIEQLRVSPAVIQPGMHIRWMGELWTVDVTYTHPRWGYYFRVHNDADGRYELINQNGADGGIEVIS